VTDHIAPSDRSRIMAQIRGTNTKPELVVRKALHRLGYRFRIHRHDLPGTPDIVLAKYRSVIFVHGCFWHQHQSKRCKLSKLSKSRLDYWGPKLAGNQSRDAANQKKLRSAGWRTLTIWECPLKQGNSLVPRLTAFLGRQGSEAIGR